VVLRLVFGPQWAAEGVFMLFAVLFMFIGAQFVGMGLLGEYIGRIYNDVRARPRYFIQRVVRQPESISRGNSFMKAVVFAYHDMGCTGTQALLEAGMTLPQSLPIRITLAKTTFWLRGAYCRRARYPGLCAGRCEPPAVD
jgi:hypothetical protein